MASAIEEATMGDKSPKSKQRDKKQKDGVKAQDAASAKTKRDGQGGAGAKPKK
jgi:hypothetical protein